MCKNPNAIFLSRGDFEGTYKVRNDIEMKRKQNEID